MKLKNSRHALRIGEVSLRKLLDSDRFTALSDGFDLGNPDPVVAVVDSLLRDGDEEEIERYGNREIQIPVMIEGDTSIALAKNEAELQAELGHANTLTWIPPDGWGEPTVFEITTSWMDFNFSDTNEMMVRRHFTLHLRALPFARAAAETTIPALVQAGDPVDPTISPLFDGTSSTGWQGGPLFEFTSSRARGYQVGTGSWATERRQIVYVRWERAATSRAGFNYIAVDWERRGGQSGASTRFFKVIVDGKTITLNEAAIVSLSPGNARSFYEIPEDATLIGTMLYQATVFGKAAARAELNISRIDLYDSIPTIGSGAQSIRSLVVAGAVRTQASIEVWSDTKALNTVLTYTYRDEASTGYTPPLRQWRTGGGTIATNPAFISGASSPLDGTPEQWDIPATAVPGGSYALLAALKADAAGYQFVEWSAATLLGGSTLGSRAGGTILNLTTSWAIYEIARITLPPMRLAVDSPAMVRLTMKSSAASDIDEGWIFNSDIGALTWVEAGAGTPETGGASSHLWIDSPTLGSTVPSYWLGSQPNRADARHAMGDERRSEEPHEFQPGALSMFLVTSGADDAQSQLRYYRRGVHHVS